MSIKALLIKKEGTKLQISGPIAAKDIKSRDDIDLVLLLCDHAETIKSENKSDMRIFEDCTKNSKLAEGSSRNIKHIRTISYMLGTILSEEIKNLHFDGVEYKS